MMPQGVFTSCTVPTRCAWPLTRCHQHLCTCAKDIGVTEHFLVHEQHLMQWPQHG